MQPQVKYTLSLFLGLLTARYVMTTINIHVNSQRLSVISPITLTELIALKQLNDTGTAIAMNSAIVSKKDWPKTFLEQGDNIDIFTLVAGG